MQQQEQNSPPPSPITIVMSTAKGLWNTGVWAGYGSGPVTTLQWAASGITVDKSQCRLAYPCHVTQDQSFEATADAVVMETVNHPKFLYNGARNTPIPFPQQQRREGGFKKPLLGMFYYEPSVWYPEYTTSDEILSHFDFVMAPKHTSDIALSMTCPWGKPLSAYVLPPADKDVSKTVAYFSGGGLDHYYDNWIQGLIHELGTSLDAYEQFRTVAQQPYSSTAQRIEVMCTYPFVLVTETVMLHDWVNAEFSQTLLAGSVPVYIGAPNILDYAPSPSSFVDIRTWITRHPRELAEYLRTVARDPVQYAAFFEWKRGGLPSSFLARLDECVYLAECRMCNHVAHLLGKV